MEETTLKQANRKSGIELLKIFSIFLIVVHHVIQTLYSNNEYIGFQNYIVDISQATTDFKYLILALLDYGGEFGNTVFFVCSAWFMLDSCKSNAKKITLLIVDTWLISVSIFIIVFLLRGGDIPLSLCIKQFFPITFANNWYITCYVLFYAIHPYLNVVINKMSQKELFTAISVMLVLYFGINFIRSGYFFESKIIVWITIYFVIAYIKKYACEIICNCKINTILVLAGFLGNVCLVLFTNYVSLYTGVMINGLNLLMWCKTCSPLMLMMAIGLFNIAYNSQLKNHWINKIASMSLFIYIIHENLLIRTYFRPLIWQHIYSTIGYAHIVEIVLFISVCILVLSCFASVVYIESMQRIARKISDSIYTNVKNIYSSVERHIIK